MSKDSEIFQVYLEMTNEECAYLLEITSEEATPILRALLALAED